MLEIEKGVEKRQVEKSGEQEKMGEGSPQKKGRLEGSKEKKKGSGHQNN